MQNLQQSQPQAQMYQTFMIQIPQPDRAISIQQTQQMQTQQMQQMQQMQLQHMQQMQQQIQQTQMNQYNQMAQQFQLCNPVLINQFFMNQYQTLQGQASSVANIKSSSRTIDMNEQNLVKQEQADKKESLRCQEDPLAPLDINAISNELRILIKYLSQEENPKQSFILQNIKILPQINQQIVAIIMERHQSQRKTKEEQIKFVLRKCFKHLKNTLDIDQGVITPLDMEKRFYKAYFEGEEEMIPFRKNSNMKTMNSQYLRKIFLSSSFVDGYKDYIEHFDEIWDAENEEKIENMVKQVVVLIQQNRIEKLLTYRRLPWIASIKNNCKNLAKSMLKYVPKFECDTQKLIRVEDVVKKLD